MKRTFIFKIWSELLWQSLGKSITKNEETSKLWFIRLWGTGLMWLRYLACRMMHTWFCWRKVHYCPPANVLLYLDFFSKAIKYLLDTMLDMLYYVFRNYLGHPKKYIHRHFSFRLATRIPDTFQRLVFIHHYCIKIICVLLFSFSDLLCRLDWQVYLAMSVWKLPVYSLKVIIRFI